MIQDALATYDLTPPVEIFLLPDAGGINNRIRGVRTGAGMYIWKSYLGHREEAMIRDEHRLLAWLVRQPLAFEVPSAIPTRTGDTLRRTPDGAGW